MKKAINHRNMRILLILIISMLCLTFCYVNKISNTVLAEPSYTPKIVLPSDKVVHRGQTFEISVDMSDNQGLIALKFALGYDSSVMTLKNVIKGDALSTLNFSTTSPDTALGYSITPFNVFWDGEVPDSSNGKLVTFVFDTDIKAPTGFYDITLTIDPYNTNIAYNQPIDVDVTNGVVELITGEFKTIYNNYNGVNLYSEDYNSDDILPTYKGETPTRQDDEEYFYEFAGWTGVVSDNVKVIIYEAVYRYIPKIYPIFYYVDGIKDDYFDNIIDDNDLFASPDAEFGSYIEYLYPPQKELHIFEGWYLDSGFTQPCLLTKMPSHELKLYGYYKYDVRETNIPKIALNVEKLEVDRLTVVARVVRNDSGFNGLVLTLDYDLTVFRLTGFNTEGIFSGMRFSSTNIEKINEENFKFILEHSENIYRTGKFLTLYFDIIDRSRADLYNITFTYNYKHDATYIDLNSEQKYTKLEIVRAEIPIGEIFHWNEDMGSGRMIDITSADGKPVNVCLFVELVNDTVDLSQEKIRAEVGKKMFLQSAYSIKLLQNGEEIAINTTLTIRIKLTAYEKLCKELKFYYYSDEMELIEQEFTIENNELVFVTDHLSNWLIFGDYNKNRAFESDSRVVTLIMYPILLAIVTMLYAFIQKGKITKLLKSKKEAHNE